MTKFPQCLSLDLPYPLAGYSELLPDLLKGPAAPVFQAKTELEYSALSICERVQYFLYLLLEQLEGGRVGRGRGAPIFDEIAKMAVFLFAYRCLQGNWLLGDLQDLPC